MAKTGAQAMNSGTGQLAPGHEVGQVGEWDQEFGFLLPHAVFRTDLTAPIRKTPQTMQFQRGLIGHGPPVHDQSKFD